MHTAKINTLRDCLVGSTIFINLVRLTFKNNEGWTLILGFLTMMIADDAFASCAGGSHGHSHSIDGEDIISKVSVSKNSPQKDLEDSASGKVENQMNDQSSHHHERHEVVSAERRRNTVTFGLLIHNAMDGMAMGAAKAAVSSSAATQTIVFWAIMMHHVPASFGYATYLRNSGLEEHIVRRYVIIFSLAAPISTCLTFFILHPMFLGVYSVSSQVVGSCLLFSAGTFLNVACVHALEEAKSGFPKWGLRQVLTLCLGAVVPGIVSWNHKH